MDRVGFGRALGVGARDAARAVIKAADAATSPNPTPGQTTQPEPSKAGATAGRQASYRVEKVRTASSGIKRGSRRFGEAVWGPVVRVSGIVWLEVTGVLFSLFAIAAGSYLWQHRADLHVAGTPRQNLLLGDGNADTIRVLHGFKLRSSEASQPKVNRW